MLSLILVSSASMLQLVTPVVNAEYLFLFPVKKKKKIESTDD